MFLKVFVLPYLFFWFLVFLVYRVSGSGLDPRASMFIIMREQERESKEADLERMGAPSLPLWVGCPSAQGQGEPMGAQGEPRGQGRPNMPKNKKQRGHHKTL